ncbi:hypothetical protein RvY_16420 [Ramazzottius varieornatus]|uniref:acid phosphatase n=1 Tax=Ramazzottius varieornatus TaxID=947166 RepID=A0A1D1VZ86_RAMVA|nr:hypothetical protein RvY_16420 [Ramazzottius varieornatus]
MYVRSTNYDRTIQSAMANMAGWFPPTQKDVWANPNNVPLAGLWRPFPVRQSDDPTLLGETECPRIDKRPYRPDLQALFDFIETKHKVLLDYVRLESGETNMTVSDGLERVSDVLRCQKYAGVKYPAWVNDTVYEKIQYLDDLRFHIWVGGNGDTSRARINGGRILKTILTDFQSKTYNKGDPAKRKAYFYSSHDNSIGGLLACLHLYDYTIDGQPVMHIPLYANTLLFELFNNNTVRILHKNDTTEPSFTKTDPIALKHPQCDTLCPLDRLMELTREYMPDDWKCECEDECDFDLPFQRPPRIPSA